MKHTQLPDLKETRSHGSTSFFCTIYQTRSPQKGVLVKHHWHDEVEIIYFPEGGFRVEINMERFEIEGECLCFINPGELHSIVKETPHFSGDDAIVFDPCILSFDSYDEAQVNLIQPIQNGKLHFPRFITAEEPAFAPIKSSFETIMHSFGQNLNEETPLQDGAVTDDLTNQLFIKSSLLYILGTLSLHHAFIPTEKTYNKKVEAVKAVLTYIRENYKEKIYIHDLASIVNMNEQYFCRFFKKSIGRSPIEYINEYRVKQATRLLRETDLTVMAVCLECGYNNLGNFLREFRKYTNDTPLQYRKHVSGNNGIS